MMGIMSKAQKVERNADHVEAPIDKPKALDGSPFLVIGYPSSSVAAFLDSPGMFSRIAVIDPPNTVTEWSAIRTGSPTSGLSLKNEGQRDGHGGHTSQAREYTHDETPNSAD